MANIEMARTRIIKKHDEATFWRRHYEVKYGQTGSEQARRSMAYYDGLRRGYEAAYAELEAIRA